MSLHRCFVVFDGSAAENVLVPLDAAQARHLSVLRLRPGSALELVLPSGAWRADLAELAKDHAIARLVVPLEENRDPPFPIHVYLPVTAQLSLMDEMLPPLVELGATRIHPVAYARSEFDARRTGAKRERWERIVLAAAEQSHRTRMPELCPVVPFSELLTVAFFQKWVASEAPPEARNPVLRREALAITSGPEGGITDEELTALRASGWISVTLGRSILRAVTAPTALLGAVQHQIHT